MGAWDGDPGDDDEAGGDDGAGFGAGDGEIAEGESWGGAFRWRPAFSNIGGSWWLEIGWNQGGEECN